MGFQLSDRTNGVYFNDRSLLLKNQESLNFAVFDKSIKSWNITRFKHKEDVPKELAKKAALYVHFQTYL